MKYYVFATCLAFAIGTSSCHDSDRAELIKVKSELAKLKQEKLNKAKSANVIEGNVVLQGVAVWEYQCETEDVCDKAATHFFSKFHPLIQKKPERWNDTGTPIYSFATACESDISDTEIRFTVDTIYNSADPVPYYRLKKNDSSLSDEKAIESAIDELIHNGKVKEVISNQPYPEDKYKTNGRKSIRVTMTSEVEIGDHNAGTTIPANTRFGIVINPPYPTLTSE